MELEVQLALAGLVLGAAACSSGPEPTNTPPAPDTHFAVAAVSGRIDTRDDIDPYIGQWVTIAGRLGSYKGIHAKLTTPGGLVLGLPHFDLVGRGRPWFEYLDRTVEVTGILHAPHRYVPGGIPDFEGPTLEAEWFRLVE